MTLLLTHPAFLDHATPPGHPECADRLRAVNQVLAEERFDKLVRGEAPEGSFWIRLRSATTNITSANSGISRRRAV